MVLSVIKKFVSPSPLQRSHKPSQVSSPGQVTTFVKILPNAEVHSLVQMGRGRRRVGDFIHLT